MIGSWVSPCWKMENVKRERRGHRGGNRRGSFTAAEHTTPPAALQLKTSIQCLVFSVGQEPGRISFNPRNNPARKIRLSPFAYEKTRDQRATMAEPGLGWTCFLLSNSTPPTGFLESHTLKIYIMPGTGLEPICISSPISVFVLPTLSSNPHFIE